jgi:nickel transport protein
MKCFKFNYIFFVSLLFFTVANMAHAHRVVVFAWMDGDTVFTESQFPDGKKVVEGEVAVYDLNGTALLNGKTNANGEFSFKIPRPVGMRIVLSAGMGHQGEWTLSEAEVLGAIGSPDAAVSETQNVKPPAEPVAATSQPRPEADLAVQTAQPALPAAMLNEAQIEQIVERVVDKKLKPVTQMLVQLQTPGPGLSDIFGGIGYILGLMGIAMYFYSRKK